MKFNYLIPIVILATTASFQVTAENNVKYVFKAMDKSLDTQLCVACANNNLSKLKRLLRRDELGAYNVAMNLNCNNQDITNFAAQYDANKTAKYLNKFAPMKYKVDADNIEIIDLAYNQSLAQSVRVIYVSSK